MQSVAIGRHRFTYIVLARRSQQCRQLSRVKMTRFRAGINAMHQVWHVGSRIVDTTEAIALPGANPIGVQREH